MRTANRKRSPSDRIATRLPGLDTILCGGFIRGGVYLLQGRPGAGKTVLANQFSFAHAAAGGRALFVTLLTESHGRLMTHLRTLDFFDPKRVGTSVTYVSGYQVLEKQKLKGLLALIRKTIQSYGATLLVIDGFITAGSLAESDIEIKKFIHELQVLVELVGCTTLLLTGKDESEEAYPVRTMVDGVVHLAFEPVGMELARTIEVVKHRGSPMLGGHHLFEIDHRGVTVYSRIEAVLGRDPTRPVGDATLRSFGVEHLDAMLGGGLRPGSMTMILGAPGSGKTLLGTSFLTEGAKDGARGLYFGFFETREELLRKTDGVGSPFARLQKAGVIEVVWQPPLGLIADALAARVLEMVRRGQVARLFIDGLGGFKDALVRQGRGTSFFNALGNELRASGVTTLFSDETQDLFGARVEVPVEGLAAMLDNIVYLRHVELGARLHTLISVMKKREGASDTALREFTITDHGIDVSATFESADAIVRGAGDVTRGTGGTTRRRAPRVKG